MTTNYGGACWHCYWGWPKPIADIYDRYVAIAGESAMHYGPAHIVWEDENFARAHVQWCLDHFDDEPRGDHDAQDLAAVRASLEALLALDDAILESEPAEYDGREPAKFPPTTEHVRR